MQMPNGATLGVVSIYGTAIPFTGHDSCAYLKDVLTRLPTQQGSDISELLPHKWTLA